jgi:uncharacterized protein
MSPTGPLKAAPTDRPPCKIANWYNPYEFTGLRWRLPLHRRLEELPREIVYHSIVHTRDEVMPALERLAMAECVEDPEDLLILRTAALYHDIGFIECSTGHEEASIRLARQTLPCFDYPSRLIERICQLIQATILPQKPNSLEPDHG